jgi:hypothetical protein
LKRFCHTSGKLNPVDDIKLANNHIMVNDSFIHAVAGAAGGILAMTAT